MQPVAGRCRVGAGIGIILGGKSNEQSIVVCLTPRRQRRKRAGNREDILYFLQNHPAIEWAKALKDKSSDTCKLAEKGKRRSAGPESKERGLGVIKLSAIAFRQHTPPRIWE